MPREYSAMGWSLARAGWCALVLVSVCAASEDESLVEQREVTFDDVFGEFDFEQRELTPPPLSPDLIKALKERGGSDPTMEQVDVTKDLVEELAPRPDGPRFVPRSFELPGLEYPVQFPPGPPTSSNLVAVCLYGDRRPRYSDSYFPASGFGLLKRMAAAVNRMESWFSMCCKETETQNQEVKLCCLRQAWETSIQSFCSEGFSVKDHQYHCCKKQGLARFNCFESAALNPAYQPTEEVPLPPLPDEPGFSFTPNMCHRPELAPRSVKNKKRRPQSPVSTQQNIDISFPPGRPISEDMESLCRYRKLRPRYDLKCLPRKGYSWLARQSKTINRVEKGFNRCCKGKGDVFSCAVRKWGEEMDRFCREEKAGKMNFPCCEKAEGQERYDCFHVRAPRPGYSEVQLAAPAGTAQNVSLHQLCETQKIIKRKFPVGFPIQGLVTHCCSLSMEQRSTCILEKLGSMPKKLCATKKSSSSSVRQCCQNFSQDPSQCLSGLLMDAIAKATNLPRLRKKKCPLS